MAALQTIDPIEMEQALVARIRDTFLSVQLGPSNNLVPLTDYVNIELRERFPDSDEDDKAISTVPDPANPDVPFTSIIQIGIPKVAEKVYVSEKQTQLDFEYPITFDMGVKDIWDNSDASLIYTNSRALFMAVYMRSRAKFKEDITLGFENCQHDFLQQDNVATVEDEESGGMLHVADWALMVHVKGINV